MKVCFIVLTSVGYHRMAGQSVEESYIDEFTKDTITTTTWVPFAVALTPDSFVRARKVNEHYFIDLRIIRRNDFVIARGHKLMFLMTDDSVIEFLFQKQFSSCLGCGAKGLTGFSKPGIELAMPLSHILDFASLQYNSVAKIRLETTRGTIEQKISTKNENIIQNCLQTLVHR